jgi:hypothetical protein
VNRKGHEYYEIIDEKWVNGKVVQKYAGYMGKNSSSKKGITPDDILPYVQIKAIYYHRSVRKQNCFRIWETVSTFS